MLFAIFSALLFFFLIIIGIILLRMLAARIDALRRRVLKKLYPGPGVMSYIKPSVVDLIFPSGLARVHLLHVTANLTVYAPHCIV